MSEQNNGTEFDYSKEFSSETLLEGLFIHSVVDRVVSVFPHPDDQLYMAIAGRRLCRHIC